MTQRKTFLITGASSGLGRAVYEVAIAQGRRAVGTVRREEDRQALEALDSERAKVVLLLAEMDNPPAHLLLGSDARELVESALRTRTEQIQAWEAVTLSTDFD